MNESRSRSTCGHVVVSGSAREPSAGGARARLPDSRSSAKTTIIAEAACARVIDTRSLVILTSPLDDEWERQVVVEIQKTLWWFLYALNTWGSSISVVNATFAAFSLYYAYYWMHDTIAIIRSPPASTTCTTRR